jgi:hypothetical protein
MFFIILYLVMFLAQLLHNFYTTLTTFFEDQSLKRNDCFTTLDTTLVQLQQFFFKLIIGSVFPYVGPTYPMVDFKKNCWSCARVV